MSWKIIISSLVPWTKESILETTASLLKDRVTNYPLTLQIKWNTQRKLLLVSLQISSCHLYKSSLYIYVFWYFDVRHNASKIIWNPPPPKKKNHQTVTLENSSHCQENPLFQILATELHFSETAGTVHEIVNNKKYNLYNLWWGLCNFSLIVKSITILFLPGAYKSQPYPKASSDSMW